MNRRKVLVKALAYLRKARMVRRKKLALKTLIRKRSDTVKEDKMDGPSPREYPDASWMVTAKTAVAVAAPGTVVPRPKEKSPVATSVLKNDGPTMHCSPNWTVVRVGGEIGSPVA